MTVRPSRLAFLPLLAALALVSGCGSKATTSGSSESGATVVGEGALAFVSVSSDLGSSQWQQLDKLAQKFSFRDQALAKVKLELAKQHLDYDQDVKPALGPEVDVVVAGGTAGASGNSVGGSVAVLMTKPDDAAKFKALIAKVNSSGGSTAVYREVNGWYLASDKQASIDKVLKGSGGALADDPAFKDALSKLPGDALVKAYLDGNQLAAFVRQAAAKQGGTPFDPSTIGLDKLEYVAASVSAENDGLRVRGASKGSGTEALGAGDYASKLLDKVPGDALALLDFRGGGISDQLKKLESNPQFAQSLQQLEAMLGVSLDDLLELVRNETGFYLQAGRRDPGVLARAHAVGHGRRAGDARQAGRQGGLARRRQVSRTMPGTRAARSTSASSRCTTATSGDQVVITSGINGIADFGGSGSKLPDSADFKEAKSAAGMPDSTGGFVYVDLKNAIPLIEGFAGLAGQSLPPSVAGNLRPLRSLVAWTAGSGDSRTFDAFLEIK